MPGRFTRIPDLPHSCDLPEFYKGGPLVAGLEWECDWCKGRWKTKKSQGVYYWFKIANGPKEEEEEIIPHY